MVVEVLVHQDRQEVDNVHVGFFLVLPLEIQLRELVPRVGEEVPRDIGQSIHCCVVRSFVTNHLELEPEDSQTILMLQSLGNLLVVNIPVDHVQLDGILVTVDGVLRAPNELIILHLPPVEVHLNELVIHVERASTQQGGRVVGHSEELESVTSVLGVESSEAQGELLVTRHSEGSELLVPAVHHHQLL